MLQDQVRNSRRGFLTSRWQRQVPLGTLFWRDMVLAGSAINLAAAFAGLMALGLKAVFLATTLLGATTLWMAILADTGATVLVTANALRLLAYRPSR